METLSPWDELLTTVGRTVEDAGRMLRGKGRKKPRVWSIDELTDLRETLTNVAAVLDQRIESLKEGNQ
jgi:hypothetical protein